MAIDYELLLRDLERELLADSASPREFEGEFEFQVAPNLSAGPLKSVRFADDPDLQAVASGHVRLGRGNDSPYPAPILSQGPGIRKVQQALIELGYSLPRYGDDSNYGQETYQAVLAYKRHFNIRTQSGYLDGIVGPQTIAHMDSRFPSGPLPACGIGGGGVISAESEYESGDTGFGLPWVTCDPLLEPTPGGLCDKSLHVPDHGVLSADGGGGVVAPGLGQFYCINKPNIHLEFTAIWIEMSPDQPKRSPTAPRYDVSLGPFRLENLIPGTAYAKNILLTPPRIANVHFVTVTQRNRIFRVTYSIQES